MPDQPGQIRPPFEVRRQKAIARLWGLQKGEHRRMCGLFTSELGFELKIVDEHGDFTWTGVFRSEPDAASGHSWSQR